MTVSKQVLEVSAAALDTWLELEQALRADVLALCDRVDEDRADQVMRRAFVRGAWGFMEGCCHGPTAFVKTVRELAGEPPGESPSGRAYEKLKQQLRACAKALAPEWEPDFSGAGWQAVVRSVALRDGLMHPKRAADLDVSDVAFDDMRAGLGWFIETIVELQKRALVHADEVRQGPSGAS